MAPKESPAPVSRDQHVPRHAETVHEGRPATVPSQPQPTVAAVPVAASGDMILPLGVVSRTDISKSLRDLEGLDDYFHQAGIRGSKDQSLPTTGKALEAVAQANSLNLLHAEDRAKLKSFLTKLKAKAPVVHMSFPSQASADFLAKLLEWFRGEVHPYVVLHVGLQPELAAGCTLRTTNKLFDFSFRKRFEKSKEKLVAALEAMDQAPDRVAVADANATVAPEAQL